ncbi:bifunctional DNA primase/helicase [Pleurocapsa sp. CCALA 161]|uniref:plasmid replication protein, CyRepA1 family n=1 Tax=Pleurocapsa sp. CCALA 161 TaxID=2107688 RepID=UPI000D04B8E0|nr:plasmid replication protein, CyRepA1 family [Pleurocapsa sp. CCALA 161]PSB08046.1 bifunctional DNA primase/helicase [Pleurocapsa sp. CCALA 161]
MDTDRKTTNNSSQNSFNHTLERVSDHHLAEWQSSSVDDKLTELNLTSLSGLTTYDYLFYALPDQDRRNDGRLRDKLLQRYQHLEHGGWYIEGLDPETNWIDVMAWGRLKPDQPRTSSNGKLVKYESPPKTPNRVTYFRVPLHLWNQVAARYGIKRYHSPLALRLADRKQPVNFWSWVKSRPEIPIVLTEGEKKAGALLSLGYATISLPGIWGGRATGEEKELHHDLLPLAQKGRTFIILFDYDLKQSTREAVYKATLATAEAIEATGASCKVALLPGPEKGVDDFLSARGDSASGHLARIINNAYSIEEYRLIGNPADDELIKYAPDTALCVPYLPNAEEIDLDRPGLTGIKSGMATGKTSRVKKYRIENPDGRFLVIGHRITLLRELSQASKLNTNLYSDLPAGQLDKVNALSITIDSLYKLKTAANRYDCIFIDEARQVMNHALAAATCKQHRHEILMSLMYFIRSAKRVIIADAHLDDNTIDFFKAMRPVGEAPLIIKNDYQSPSRDVYYYQGADSSALAAKLIAAVEQGKKVMVVSDSKKTILKLEAVLIKKLGIKGGFSSKHSQSKNKVIWTIHADNSGSKENQHFIKNISSAVEDVDVLLASPSLCTGVDVQGDRFDEVYGLFNAVSLSATDCLQALHRYRKQVPLHIWVAPRPSFGYQNINPDVIKREMLQLEEFNGFLMGIDLETGEKTPINGWAVDAYCQVKAKHNRSLNNLRDHLHRLLARMGYSIIPVEENTNDGAKSDLKDAAKKVDAERVKRVIDAEKIVRHQYLQLKNKAYLTPFEKYKVERFRIEDGYGQSVTEELVKRDQGGAYLGQLINLEAVLSPAQGEVVDSTTGKKRLLPPQIVLDKDKWELENLPFLPDRQHHCTQWMMWQTLGLPKILERLFAGGEYKADDPDLIKMAETAISYRDNIKTILGFWIPDNCSPTWLLGMLVQKLGLKTASRKKGRSGQQVKFYSLAIEELTLATQVLEYRHEQRIKREERKLQRQFENRLYQVMMESQYGLISPDDSISTPDQNTNTSNKQQGEDMAESKQSTILEKIQPYIELWSEIVSLGNLVIKELFNQVSCTDWVRKLLISQLIQLIILIP